MSLSSTSILHPEITSPRYPNGVIKIVRVDSVISTIEELKKVVTTDVYQAAQQCAVGGLAKGSLSSRLIEFLSTIPPLPDGPNGADAHTHDHSVVTVPGDPMVETYIIPNENDVVQALRQIFEQQNMRAALEAIIDIENHEKTRDFFALLESTGHNEANTILNRQILDMYADLFFVEINGNLVFTGDDRAYKIFEAHEEEMSESSVAIPNEIVDLSVIYRQLNHARSLRKKRNRKSDQLARHLQINDPISAYGQLALRVRNTPVWDLPVDSN